jgi:hypothetical protein
MFAHDAVGELPAPTQPPASAVSAAGSLGSPAPSPAPPAPGQGGGVSSQGAGATESPPSHGGVQCRSAHGEVGIQQCSAHKPMVHNTPDIKQSRTRAPTQRYMTKCAVAHPRSLLAKRQLCTETENLAAGALTASPHSSSQGAHAGPTHTHQHMTPDCLQVRDREGEGASQRRAAGTAAGGHGWVAAEQPCTPPTTPTS